MLEDRKWRWIGALVLLAVLFLPCAGAAARLKDIASIRGVGGE